MNAWRLRAIVYGLLAIVCGLVLWQSGALAGDPAPTHTYKGATSQGKSISVLMSGAHIAGFDATAIKGRCLGGVPYSIRWYPAIPQGNVTYRESGSHYEVHEWPHPDYPHPKGARVNSYMSANLAPDGRELTGTLRWVLTTPRNRCEAGPIAFGVTRNP